MVRPATAANRLLSGQREPVRAASTGNVSNLRGFKTVDGVALTTGDRVLLRLQSNATENGIYVVSVGQWYRAADARDPRAITRGVTVATQEGTVNAGIIWRFATILPNIGDDPVEVVFYISGNIEYDVEAIAEAAIADAAAAAATAAVAPEVQSRIDGDAFLATYIGNEVQARIDADAALLTGVNDAIDVQRTERIAADAALGQQIQTGLEDLVDQIEAETEARIAGDNASAGADAYFTVPTFASLGSLHIPPFTAVTRLAGYYAAGDAGAWKWKRVASQPTHTARQRSLDRFLPNGSLDNANGGWWEPIADPFIPIEACGAKPDWQIAARTGTNNVPMVQAAFDVAKKQMNAKALAGGCVLAGQGNFGMADATVTWHEACKLLGRGRDLTVFWRAGNYGDTFRAGAAAAGPNAYARQVECHNVSMNHSLPYDQATNAALLDKATTGAHLRIYGALKAKVCSVAFSRLPGQLVFHGGANVELRDILTYGVWDPENADKQEGIAQIDVLYDAVHGLPTNFDIQFCYHAGQASNSRTLSWTTGDNGVVTRTYARSIGSKFGLRITGVENLTYAYNHAGGLSEVEVFFNQAAGSGMLDMRVGPGNFFDGSSHGRGILWSPQVAGVFGLNLKVFGNTSIDQVNALKIDRFPGGTHSLYGLEEWGNTYRNMIGTPVMLGGVKGFEAVGGISNAFNRFNLSRVDVNFAYGIVAYDIAEKGQIKGRQIGGGVRFGPAPAAAHTTYPEATAPFNADPNYCWTDAYIAPGLTDVFYYDNWRSGCTTKITQAAPAGMR